ncbi:hypothetical protein BJY00DRAFT_298514 [Aspergillus carlsbadensis]|nr:hypothetical protein BJY00DRAFT_298514 [Aspergillus carlsbadensis]
MESAENLVGLRGLFQDLSALPDPSFGNIDRLRVELEAHIHDFRDLLDKPTKNNASRQTVLSGKITIDDVEYSVNEEFRQGALQLADALDLDELLAALLFFKAQEDAQMLDRPPIITAIIQFHQRRLFLLESLRLILQESFEIEREATQELAQNALALILETNNGQLRNAGLFTRKCLKSMESIEKWLVLLGEQIQKASLVGEIEDRDVMEAIEHQRHSLLQQHESLGATVYYLFKGPYTNSEDLRILVAHLRRLDRFDGVLVHYIPSIISSFVQHGSPERADSYNDARSLNTAIVSTKDGQTWAHQPFHAAVIALWLAVYSGWDFDAPPALPPGTDLEKEAEERTKTFMTALDDGGLDLLLSICSAISSEDWSDPARSELVTLLLRESASTIKESSSAALEADSCSDYLKELLMENFEVFTESCVANMPDAVRRLKADEDLQRLDQITALRDGLTSNLHRSVVEARTHLESFLVIMSFAFEGRPDAAQEIWADPDGNIYGFLQWSSKRQTVPRVSAFCELLCSISSGEENAASAHRFLLEEDKFMTSKFKRSTSMNWAQMFAELQIYATRVTEKPSPQTLHRARKFEPADISEPESPVMLSCYLRLVGHLSRQSATVREWMLHHPSFNIVSTLLTLCSGPLPTHLRATVFQALGGLMTDRSAINGNEMWLSLDQWISSGSMGASGANKVPLVSNPLILHEQQAFQKIGESFDQTNAFVAFLHNLVSPATDSAEYHLWLPFPESLGSTYRMPGIEPYIDFVLGHALSKKVPELNERQARLLTFNCLDFVQTSLKSFNEALVTVLSAPSALADSPVKTSTLHTYVRLHPFARVAEWLYNEEVVKVIFANAHRDVNEVTKAPHDSIMVMSLIRSLQVMDTILDLQSTYLNIVRPFIRSQAGSRVNVANSSLAAFEDCVLNNLKIIPLLCLYCSSGHELLTITSLGLLEKLSSSQRLNKLSTPELSRWRSANKIVEVLTTEVDVDNVARPFVSQMQPEARELDFGPKCSGYVIRENILGLLNSCLGMISDRPTLAHILLGFSSVGNFLDVRSEGLFTDKMSLLHAIIEFLETYPDQLNESILPWLVHMKRLALEVLRHLWSSKISSYFTLAEMRGSGFLHNLIASQPIVGPTTLWDGLPVAAERFWVCESTSALAEFLMLRSYLFDYAATEIRSAAKSGSPTLQAAILSTLFGSSPSATGVTVPIPTVFDLFDFADLDITFHAQPPEVDFLGGLKIELCAKPQAAASLVLYEIGEVEELIRARREQLVLDGELRPQDEEIFATEANSLILFLQATNKSRQITCNRHIALRSWAELLTTILTCSELDGGRKLTFILHSTQLILPKLETAIEGNLAEGLELARLAETLVGKLESPATKSTHSRRNSDVVDEKLHQLFQVCIRGIILDTENVDLKESFYNICSLYISRIISPGIEHQSMRNHSQQVVKSAGRALIEAICDDAYSGQETCRVSALLLLDFLAILDRHADSVLAESISESNYLALFLDSVRVMPLELRNAQATDTPLLLSYYESLLSLLQQLCQTKSGATHVIKAGLFQAVRDSQLISADPDLGIDIDNPDALRKYYGLLDSVLRVIVTAVFSRGLHNEQMIDQTRSFLTENRQSMVGIFKRFAKIGGAAAPEHHEALTNIAKSYTALVAATDFLEQNSRGATEQRSGKRKSAGKRKHTEREESSQQPQQQQANLPALFHRNQAHDESPSKRARVSPPPHSSVPSNQPGSGNMYSFSGTGSKPSGPGGGRPLHSNPTFQVRSGNASSQQSNFTPHTGAKRLVVKNLRTGNRKNQDSYFDKVWGQLDAALSAIFGGGKPEISIEELYKGAENVCRQGRAAVLSKRVQGRCREHVAGSLRETLVEKAQMGSNIDTLRAAVDAWKVWQSMLVTIRWVFYYLDQSFLLHSKELPVIREMGLIQFRQHVYADPALQPKILQGACDLVAADRNQEHSSVADSSLLRNAIELFHGLDVYTSGFEPGLVIASNVFFTLWSQQEASGYLASYVDNSHRLIEREVSRCEQFSFNRTTKQKLSDLLDQTLVTDQEDVLLNQKDVLGLLRTGNKVALGQLYTLLERKELGAKLKGGFITYIGEEGSSIVFDEEKEAEMVTRLLDFKKQLDDIWNESFHRNEDIGHALREAFEGFMNKGRKSESTGGTDNPKTGEMIAKYVDRLLRGGWRLAPTREAENMPLTDEDAEINRQLDQVLDLFRFVHGKAVFEAFYKNDLARRLLMGRSASDDAEKSMLARLKTECGSSFTHNLESMFKDMEVARDEMGAYSSIQRERRIPLPVDLHVNVLSAAAWPTYPDVQVRIPQEISIAIDDFQKFYDSKYNAHCQIRARFPKGDKELAVSSFQAIVLLLFNDLPEGGSLNYRQIQDATSLSDKELKRTLQSLACAKYRVLTKKPKGRDVNETDEFAYNHTFTDQKMRIKINQIQLKETKEENKTTHERVAADRHYETQAAIVRIMKSRKTISHAELVSEVISATKSRGELDVTDIKKNIERLIEKDYMEREGQTRYVYVA